MADKPARVPMKSPDGDRIRYFPAEVADRRARKGWSKVTPATADKIAAAAADKEK